jgi:hypothetical protein
MPLATARQSAQGCSLRTRVRTSYENGNDRIGTVETRPED